MEEKHAPQDLHVRVALLEDFKERTIEHHRQTMEKLDTVLKLLGEKQCTLHSARMLQLDQDNTKIEKTIEAIWKRIDSIDGRIAAISGGIAVLAFIANRIFG